MSCGRLGDDYEERFHAIDFEALYQRGIGKPLFEHFKNVVITSKEYDYVLVDSRTGFTDVGGICTRDLADHIVLVTGLNRQNVDGTIRFLTRAKKYGGKIKGLCVVVSPVPTGLEELREERKLGLFTAIEQITGEPPRVSFHISYHPRLALDEEPFVYEWSNTSLFREYELVAWAIRNMARDTLQDISRRFIQAIKEGMFKEALHLAIELRAQDESYAEATLSAVAQSIVLEAVPALRKNAEPFLVSLCERFPEDPHAWRLLGELRRTLGNYTGSIDALIQALKKAESKGDSLNIALAHYSFGKIREALGEYDAALQEFRIALKISEELDYKEDIATNHYSIGQIYQALGEYDAALQEFQMALQISEELRYQGNIAICRCAIGDIYQTRGDYDSALDEFHKALTINQNLGRREGVAANYHIIGENKLIRGEYDAALEEFQKALKISEELDNRDNVATGHRFIGVAYGMRRKYDEALERFKVSLKIEEELSRLHMAALCRGYIGLTLAKTGDTRAGADMISAALADLESHKQVVARLHVQIMLAEARYLSGDYQQALNTLEVHWKEIERRLPAHIKTEGRVLRAKALLAAGRQKEAADDLKVAVEFFQTREVRTPVAEEAASMLNEISSQPDR